MKVGRKGIEKIRSLASKNDQVHMIFRYLKKLALYGSKRANALRKEDQNRKKILKQERERITEEETERQQRTVFGKKIIFSILVPLYNTPAEFLEEMLESVFRQTYSGWELCLADGSDAEHKYVGEICRKYAETDPRIIYRKLEQNGGISENTNVCIEIASGNYIALFDHDDLLHPYALFEYMKAICEKDADFIYSDECSFHKSPDNAYWLHLKPDYAPDTLRGSNYICHFTAFKRELLKKAGGGFRKQYDGSQDYDLILRLTEKAEHIVHIPNILYYWRSHDQSTASGIQAKPYTVEAGRAAVADHLERIGLKGTVSNLEVPCIYKVQYEIDENPLISLIIPNDNGVKSLARCLKSIIDQSIWKNYEIIIVDLNSRNQEVFDYYSEIQKSEKIRIVEWIRNKNISEINNFGVRFAKGEYFLFLSVDTEIITSDWIGQMLMFAQREDVGAVGAMIWNPDFTVRQGGMILSPDGTAESFHKGYKRGEYGYANRMILAQNLSAVSGECMMIPRKVWEEVHGMDAVFEKEYADADLCMRIRKASYLVVWTPYAELHSSRKPKHHDSRKKKPYSADSDRFMKKWGKELENGDPYYNPNLRQMQHSDTGIQSFGRTAKWPR